MSVKFQSALFLAAATLLVQTGQYGTSTSRHRAATRRRATTGVPAAQAAAAKGFVTTGCDETLWEHVYHPQRLAIVEKCIAVTGIIHHVKKEPDGDEHIQLQLDSQFEGLLNGRNRTAQADCLILEPICQNPVTQADAVDACRDFHSAVELPTESHAHVRVLGSYVLDTDKPGHGWMEIHPVTRIEVVQ